MTKYHERLLKARAILFVAAGLVIAVAYVIARLAE
jgi:hypothetical protein